MATGPVFVGFPGPDSMDFPTRRQWAEGVLAEGGRWLAPHSTYTLEPDQLRLRREAELVFVHDGVLDYAVRLVSATRRPADHGLGELTDLIAHGASPRATLGLLKAGRALAMMRGRSYVLPQDVFDVSRDILRHRVLLGYDAVADGVEADAVVERIVGTVPAPRVAPAQGDLSELAS